MGSADYRIISQKVAESATPDKPDLWRYLITYTSTGQPQYLAQDDRENLFLTTDEKLAIRFPTSESAQSALNELPIPHA